MVPNQGAFPSGDMWQYLEAFSVVTSECVGDASDILPAKAMEAAKHPIAHRAATKATNSQAPNVKG